MIDILAGKDIKSSTPATAPEPEVTEAAIAEVEAGLVATEEKTGEDFDTLLEALEPDAKDEDTE